MLRIAAVLIFIGLAGCGMTGPLTLPPGPAKEPLLGHPKPAPAKDVSTIPSRTSAQQ